MKHAEVLDPYLADVRNRLLARGDHLRARGLAIYDRWDGDELETDAVEIMRGSFNRS